MEKQRPVRSQFGINGRKVSENKPGRCPLVNPQLLDPTKRRPPLVRAMSAPSQHNRTANLKRASQQTPRRRKVLPVKEEHLTAALRQTFTSVQIKEDDDLSEEDEGRQTSNKIRNEPGPRKSSAKSRNPRATTFTCDQIVTLVSLLDSGGSDSERERSSDRGNDKKEETPTAEKPPTLRKAGKSGELSC